jgi:hypothetical protein
MRSDPDEQGPDADEFGRVVDILSSTTPDDAAHEEPPDDMWDRIAGRLSNADQPTVLASPAELRIIEPGPDADRPDEMPSAPPAVVVDLDHRRRQRWVRIAAVAAVVVLAAGTYGVISANSSDSTRELVASIDLDPLKDTGNGTAELVVVDGVEQVSITAEGLPPAPSGHHYEMWLIDAAVTNPQSLGQLPPGQDTAVVDVPAGVDPDEFPIVDINVQVDGEAQHSGVETSVLRGTLA